MPELKYIRVSSPIAGKGTISDPLRLLANSIGSSYLQDSGVTAGTYHRVTVNAKGLVTAGDNPSGATAPNKDEQPNVTGASITIAGISSSTPVVMHFRNGILQGSSHYTVGSNTITPTAAGGGAYDEDNLITFWWD